MERAHSASRRRLTIKPLETNLSTLFRFLGNSIRPLLIGLRSAITAERATSAAASRPSGLYWQRPTGRPHHSNIKSADASLRIVERPQGKLKGHAGPSLAQKVKQTGHQVFCIEQIQVRA
jgi:hypothetical protein